MSGRRHRRAQTHAHDSHRSTESHGRPAVVLRDLRVLGKIMSSSLWPRETAFWRLAQNEHSSPVGRTQRETVTAKVHAERNAELLKRSPRNPASAQRSRRSLIASLLRSSPRGP
ncbi:hypothetical protein ROHU_008603 [Labeo rohita]|uniref:Uncharacterized protein n=1 Tax=Labeo rohita TaxID=84645 RepID=A0A498M951_LABRO|nr:hypothetical protein ROHU_008603 [Labeo rohita]